MSKRVLEDDQREEEKESLDKCCWANSTIVPRVPFLVKEAERSERRKERMAGLPEEENTSHPHLVACQSAKIQKAPSMLLQQNVVKQLLGELNLCSQELGVTE